MSDDDSFISDSDCVKDILEIVNLFYRSITAVQVDSIDEGLASITFVVPFSVVEHIADTAASALHEAGIELDVEADGDNDESDLWFEPSVPKAQRSIH
ncbi:MAG: hypothetical protein MN733_26230 [Nitrososphaera sp.]|nr:hypothetical protein [Nitrososphaera sp.]